MNNKEMHEYYIFIVKLLLNALITRMIYKGYCHMSNEVDAIVKSNENSFSKVGRSPSPNSKIYHVCVLYSDGILMMAATDPAKNATETQNQNVVP